MLSKKNILQKTAQVGFFTGISKILGTLRENLQIYYMGASEVADAFSAAFKIPYVLRRVLAEGALNAAFIPTLIRVIQKDKEEANRLITLVSVIIAFVSILICLSALLFSKSWILVFAPGFKYKPIELETAIKLIKILIFFAFFVSSTSVLSGAMNAKNHFSTPALGPLILNIFYIAGLIICSKFNLEIKFFALFVLAGSVFQFILSIKKYLELGYKFEAPTKETLKNLCTVSIKFIPCFLSVSSAELSILIDNRFASLLPAGTYTLLGQAFKFMNIPLAIFATAFSSVLLPHFVIINQKSKSRMAFYFLESSKLILLVTLPTSLIMMFHAHNFFDTIFHQFYPEKFGMGHVITASHLLNGFLIGLFFFSLNRLILSVYHSMGKTFIPTLITLFGALTNLLLNYILVPKYGAFGVAFSTSISGMVQSVLLVTVLSFLYNFKIYFYQFFKFLGKLIIQTLVGFSLMIFVQDIIKFGLIKYNTQWSLFFLNKIGMWLWICPTAIIPFAIIYYTKNIIKNRIYFIS